MKRPRHDAGEEADDRENACFCCLEATQTKLNCNHLMCARCMISWRYKTCGLCRKSYEHDETFKLIQCQISREKASLFTAIEMGSLHKVESLLVNGNLTILSVDDENNSTLLMKAVWSRQTDIINYLIARGIDINEEDDDCNSALMIACRRGYLDGVNILLNCGREINIDNQNVLGRTALSEAVYYGFSEIVTVLLSKNPDLEIADEDDNTPFTIAILKNNLEIAKQLRAAGASMNSRNYKNETPLSIAVSQGKIESVKYLLGEGCSVNERSGSLGDSVLILASRAGSTTIVELLLSYKNIKIEMMNNLRNTAVMEAAKHGFAEIVKMLIEKNANVLHINRLGGTALDYADEGGFQTIQQMIMNETLIKHYKSKKKLNEVTP